MNAIQSQIAQILASRLDRDTMRQFADEATEAAKKLAVYVDLLADDPSSEASRLEYQADYAVFSAFAHSANRLADAADQLQDRRERMADYGN